MCNTTSFILSILATLFILSFAEIDIKSIGRNGIIESHVNSPRPLVKAAPSRAHRFTFYNIKLNTGKISCPGGNQTCADSYTCCLNPSGTYSCCPEKDGVCCSDHIHCCPSGSICDTKAGKCSKSTTKVLKTENVICPGGYKCSDQSTCCLNHGGNYGCCPFKNATCCSDLEHCCPEGYDCDVSGKTCQRK